MPYGSRLTQTPGPPRGKLSRPLQSGPFLPTLASRCQNFFVPGRPYHGYNCGSFPFARGGGGSCGCFSTYMVTTNELLHTVPTDDHGLFACDPSDSRSDRFTLLTHLRLFHCAALRTAAGCIGLNPTRQNHTNELTANETSVKQQTITLACLYVF